MAIHEKIKSAVARIKVSGFDERVIASELLEMYAEGTKYVFREWERLKKKHKRKGRD